MKKITGVLLIVLGLAFFAFKISEKDPSLLFLDSLSEEQKAKTQLPFDHESKEAWHFFPSEMWKRPGISLKELTADQQVFLFTLLKSNLSKTGYDKLNKIIDLENVLIEMKSNVYMRDPKGYNVVFYGNPAKDKLWAWSFEGHHISLNFTIVDGVTSIAPRFFGASPATIPSGIRKGERALALEENLGLELIQKMGAAQRVKATIQEESFPDIVTSNASKVERLEATGIKLQELNKDLQKTLVLLINTYLSNMPEELAERRMKVLKKETFDDIRFSWAGATVLGKGHYYRIQGESFLIEFDNTQNNANHIHSVWRDFDGDFGRDLIKEHYHRSPH